MFVIPVLLMDPLEKADLYLAESFISDFGNVYPFHIPPKLLAFLEEPKIQTSNTSEESVRKRLGSVNECTSSAKYLCRQLIEEINQETYLIDDHLHPQIVKKKHEWNQSLTRKLTNEKNQYVSEFFLERLS